MKVLVFLCLVGVAVCAPLQQLGQIEEEEIPPQPYQFSLNVADDETTNYQHREESQDSQGVVEGQYSWVAPNGFRYTIIYKADAAGGFQAQTLEEPTDIVVKIPVHKPQDQGRI